MRKKYIAAGFAVMFALVSPIQAYALSEDGYADIVESHNGSRNEYNGERAETRDDAKNLEQRLRNEGYIWLSPRSDDVTEDELELYQQYLDSVFGDDEIAFTENENLIYYVYEPAWKIMLTEIRMTGEPSIYADMAFQESSVLIDYDYYISIEMVGTHSTKWGDGIPDDYEKYGFMHVLSPLDVTVTFEEFNSHIFYDVEVPKGESNIKMLSGCYYIREINGTPIAEVEEVLPYSNNIVINQNHQQTFYELELAETEAKYKIKGNNGDTFEMELPNETYEPVTEEVIFTPQGDKNPVSKGMIIAMLAGGSLLILISVIALLKRKNKKRRRKV